MNKSANYFENVARKWGLSIKIPRPCKTMINVSILTNGIVGVGLLASGFTFGKAPLKLLGTLGIAGAVLLALEEDKDII